MAEGKSKLCIIYNGRFSYNMIVDGKNILFQGSENADYFEKHYASLEYKVTLSECGNKN